MNPGIAGTPAQTSVPQESAPSGVTSDLPPSPVSPSRGWRTVLAGARFAVGLLFLQSVLGSLAIMGWTYRLMQRTALKAWWRTTPFRRVPRDPDGFTGFVAGDNLTRVHVRWPGLIAQAGLFRKFRTARGHSGGRPWRLLASGIFGSLVLNIRIGVQALFNTGLLTLPGAALWLFSWYDGWNNSFNKGYENAVVGPALGILGIAAFIAAMLYLPMAQARQAVSGEWKRFFEFNLVWGLVRRRWAASAGLAAGYAFASVPVTVLAALPMFYPQINPSLENLSPDQARELLASHCLWTGLWVLPAFVALRWIAARVYASALLEAVQRGSLTEDDLAPIEWRTLERLGLMRSIADRTQPWMVRFITWAGTRLGRFTLAATVVLLWFAVVAQVYIGQFINYRGALAWLNQPLIQLPWLRILPPSLHDPGQDLLGAAVILGLGWISWRLTRSLRSPRHRGALK